MSDVPLLEEIESYIEVLEISNKVLGVLESQDKIEVKGNE